MYVLDKYLSKQQSKKAAFTGNHYIQSISADVNTPCFFAIPCEKNSLGKTVSEMFCEAGVEEEKLTIILGLLVLASYLRLARMKRLLNI